jgi:serine/threonine-protein kinase
MRMIKCRKCGSVIDASLGECPVCGAIYYILPESEETPDAKHAGPKTGEDALHRLSDVQIPKEYNRAKQSAPEPEEDFTRVFQAPPAPPPKAGGPSAPEGPRGAKTPGAPARARAPVPPKYGRRRSRRTAGFIVGALALIAVRVVLLSVMSGAFDFGGKKETMPDVYGLSKELAVDTLRKLGLQVETEEARSDKAAGTVIGQSIPKGQGLEGNETVLLTISAGGEGEDGGQDSAAVTVPSVRGYTYAQAKEALEAMGLSITRNEDEYSSQPEGQAIAQEPEAGQTAERGSFVKVTFSKGEEPAEEFTIAVTVGKGGSVSPRGRVTVQAGGRQTFLITPDEGYEVREIKVDGIGVEAAEAYTFDNVADNHTLYVVFQASEETPEPTPEPTSEPTPENSPEPTPEATDAAATTVPAGET